MNAKEINNDEIEKVIGTLNESTPLQLVPSFAYLTIWLSKNFDSEAIVAKNVHIAVHILHLIAIKVPPIILLCGLYDLNWTENRIRISHSMIFLSFFERIQTVRTYMEPIAIQSDLSRFSRYHFNIDTNLAFKYPIFVNEIETDSSFRRSIVIHFQRLILDNAPLLDFKIFLSYPNANTCLTTALIELLKKINRSRKLTHIQQLYHFSTIFKYISSFSLSYKINILLIAQEILKMPFVSPFLLIALVFNVHNTFNFCYFLVPPKLTQENINEEEAKEAIRKQFLITDLSFDNTLDKLANHLTPILESFFLENKTYEYNLPENPDFIDKILSIFFSKKVLLDKIQNILIKEMEKQITSPEIICSNVYISKYLIHIVLRDIEKYATSGLTSNFWKSFAAFVAYNLPSINDSFTVHVLKNTIKDKNHDVPEILIAGILNYGVHLILNLSYENHLIPFLFECLKFSEGLENLSRLLLIKLIRCDIIQITPKIIEYINKCEDIILIIEYIEGLQSLTEISQFDDYATIKKLTSNLINKLPYNYTLEPTLVLNSFMQENSTLNATSGQINNIIKNYLQSTSIDLSRTLNTEIPHIFLVLRILSTSHFVQKFETARCLTEKVLTLLSDRRPIKTSVSSCFSITSSMMALPLAQLLLKQLLVFRHYSIAVALLDAISKTLQNDETPLRWIFKFLTKNYIYLNSDIKFKFDHIVQELSKSKYNEGNYYSPYNGYKIKDIIINLQKQRKSFDIHNDYIRHEIISPFTQSLMFSVISVLVRTDSISDIISGIVDPLYQPFVVQDDDNVQYSISRFLSFMPLEIGYGVFSSILKHQVSMIPLNILKVYLSIAPIDVFCKICESSSELIKLDDNRLRSFIHIVMPHFTRLKSEEEITTKFLCGLLENVSSTTPRQLQENVIDAVGMVYVMMKLHKKRAILINSAKHFTPELKAIIASSLDIDFEISRSPTRPVKPANNPRNMFNI